MQLYRKNSFGIGTWRAWYVIETATRGKVFVAHSSSEGGSEIVHSAEVVINQSGRNIEQQLQLELNSRVSRQKDKGYKETREEALLGSTNQLGLRNPMLAQKIIDVRLTQRDFENAYMQPKYDGHRCLITRQGDELIAYTRKGKLIHTIGHILEDVWNWLQNGDTLDGELYIHGLPLQTIGSYIKVQQEGSRRLTYRAYDIMTADVYSKRYRLLTDLLANSRCPQIHLAPTVRVSKMSEVYELFRQHRAQGFEGSMLRIDRGGYQDAKRADQLLKVKEREDTEVTVLSGRPSSQGWAILTVRTDWGVTFDVSAPGTLSEKLEVMENIEKYIGRRLTVEYACLTNDKVPFHCVAMRWHDEL